MFKKILLGIALVLISNGLNADVYLGNLNTNKFDPNSVNNPFGNYGSKYSSLSINNEFGKYGSQFSMYSANNPYAIHAPKLYDQDGIYLGKLSANKFDPESIFNTFGIYGSKFSPNSIWNVYSLKVISIIGE